MSKDSTVTTRRTKTRRRSSVFAADAWTIVEAANGEEDYYWNTMTGQTSWTLPSSAIQTTSSSSLESSSTREEDSLESSPSLDMIGEEDEADEADEADDDYLRNRTLNQTRTLSSPSLTSSTSSTTSSTTSSLSHTSGLRRSQSLLENHVSAFGGTAEERGRVRKEGWLMKRTKTGKVFFFFFWCFGFWCLVWCLVKKKNKVFPCGKVFMLFVHFLVLLLWWLNVLAAHSNYFLLVVFPIFPPLSSFFFLSSCSSSSLSLSLSLSFSTPSGLFRNFKRRYFYLKDDRLEYWKTPPGDEDTTELPSDGDTPLHHHRSTSSVISTTNDELKCSKCFFLARTTDIEVRKKKNKKTRKSNIFF